MKFSDTHFEDYIEANKTCDLHPKLDVLYKKFPENIQQFRNLIFYGPKGVGKYTQTLKAIKRYSPSELKYEKKILVSYNKSIYYFKISDIHFEIDMGLLGCQSKMLWNEVYYNILDIVSAKTEKIGIIVCKNFQDIHGELLDTFYSYMQTLNQQSISLKFILLTEEISFIPDNIINCCQVISVPRPSKTQYNKCLKTKLPNDFQLEEIVNIKDMRHIKYNINCATRQEQHPQNQEEIPHDINTNINTNIHTHTINSTTCQNHIKPYKSVCNKIINEILNIDELKFNQFRDLLYDIFIYDLDITDCIWYILNTLIEMKKIKHNEMIEILTRTFSFLQYYNNNYRPIYHLENYICYLISKVHGFQESN